MNTMLRKLALPAALTAALLLGACQNMMPAPQKTLYERLGGKDAITAVVDDFVGNVAAASASTAILPRPIYRALSGCWASRSAPARVDRALTRAAT